MNIYTIASELEQILHDSANSQDGELTDEQSRRIEDLLQSGSVKVADLLFASQQACVEAHGILEEVRRLDKLYRQRMRRHERMRHLVGEYMHRTHQNRITTPIGDVCVQVASPRVKIDGDWEHVLPPEFVRTNTERKPDLAGLLKSWREGNGLPPGVTVERGTCIVVR